MSYVRRSKEYLRAYYYRNKSQVAIRLARYLNNLKIKTFSIYCDGDIRCMLCPQFNPERRIGALTIDHDQDGSGNSHRASIKVKGGSGMYKWLKRNNYPKGFSVVCMNCNIKKYLEFKRRNLSVHPVSVAGRKRSARMKLCVFEKLGKQCKECKIGDIDILTIHHVNNDGAAHRAKIAKGRSGDKFYEALLKDGDFSNLESRCFSCNCCEEWQTCEIK